MSTGPDDFLARWARRKAEARRTPAPAVRPVAEAGDAADAARAGPAATPAEAPGAPLAPADAAAGDAAQSGASPEGAAEDRPTAAAGAGSGPRITEAELAALPPVEDATDAEALRGYLRPGAPAALRAAALRRMWTLNPLIRGHVDPALDYAFDWNTPGGAPWSPLGADFDAGALADRLLGRTAPTPAGAAPPRVADAQPSPGAGADQGAGAGSDPGAGPAPGADAASDAAPGTPTPSAPDAPPAQAAAAQPTPETPPQTAPAAGAPATPPRRHGGARPA